MALRNIRELGDPILLKQSKDVKELTPRLKELIDDMWDTMHEKEGVGLAAVQVGILKRIFVVETDEEHKAVFINPVITSSEGEQTGNEGCLSVPGKVGEVTRPEKVTVDAYDIDMKPFHIEAEGFFARAICHEYDHLDGTLYIDKVNGRLYDEEELMQDEEVEASE